ncbi:SOS-response transcriptional repressor (RecA-mediated autopeptidase) [Rubidibacter lacunae KORDI 51-2]|uniref:SOS-response transcriptional repressor (RecA-mediated autopeptidase) n=1 Tax=Rubidibacter lacunae KORDI 51-2 TaxID=582515 RepID=U5D8V4_9CHRO|nr:SOS-response transcriptional repressor (RecA-mediated autopeptidase) [Rubidibacter lacunae KORDI 51-2]
MRKALSPKQQVIYEAIVHFVRHRRYPPTYRKLMRVAGLSSLAPVQSRLKSIERKGWIRRRPGYARAIELVEVALSKTCANCQHWQDMGAEPVHASRSQTA